MNNTIGMVVNAKLVEKFAMRDMSENPYQINAR